MPEHYSKIEDAAIAAIFDGMRLDMPGLEAVAAALESGDVTAAEVAYLRHYRDRRQPVLDWSGEGGFEVDSSNWDFLDPRPDMITWRDRDKLRPHIRNERGYCFDRGQGYWLSDYALLDLADMLLEDRVFIPYHPEDGVQHVGSDWNWEHMPPPGGAGQRWPMSLVYQYCLRTMTQAYWLTGDDRYIAKSLRIATSYISYVPHKSDWMWIPDMQLALNYQQLMPFFLSWDGLAPRDFCTIQYFLSGLCADSMEAVVGAPGNQLFFNGLGLLWLAVGMPEFQAAARWRERGLRETTGYFLDDAAYPDGSSKENSHGYTAGTAGRGFEVLKLTRGNGIPDPNGMREAMVQRAEFLAFTAKPDGSYVWTGDSKRGSGLPFVRNVAEAEGRDDLLYVATAGERGTAPAHSSIYYAWGGVGVMRSNWAADACYLYFDVGPFGVVHGHEGKLAIEVVAYGRSLVEDFGIHTYGQDPRDAAFTDFFLGTKAHNNVLVDGQGQVRQATGPKTVGAPLSCPWHSSAGCDYLAADYVEGYGAGSNVEPRFARAGGEHPNPGIDTSVTHRRSVVFVKAQEEGEPEYWIVTDWLAGSGDHRYEQLYHLVPTPVAVDESGRTVRTASPGVGLAFLPVAPDTVELEIIEGRPEPDLQGWYCGAGAGGRPVPAPCVVYRTSGVPAAMIQTVLWPMRSAAAELPRVEVPEGAPPGWAQITRPDGSIDLYCSPEATGRHEHGELSFTGTACLLHLAASGGVRSWDLIEGSSLAYGGRVLSG